MKNILFLLRAKKFKPSLKRNENSAGFSLLELMAVVLIIGILSAIAAPSWLGFINNQRLGSAQDEVYRAMRIAQSNAKAKREAWQVSVRTEAGTEKVQWAIHQAIPTIKWMIKLSVCFTKHIVSNEKIIIFLLCPRRWANGTLFSLTLKSCARSTSIMMQLSMCRERKNNYEQGRYKQHQYEHY